MGNNEAYTIFQKIVIGLYDLELAGLTHLTLSVLDVIGQSFAGVDIDSGGDTGLVARDGVSLEQIVAARFTPRRARAIQELPEDQRREALWDLFHALARERWKWW